MTNRPLLRRLRPAWRLLPAALLCLAACARETGTIVIGLAGPMTDPLGVAQLRAARLAVDQINQRGGLRGGRLLRLKVVDDSGSANGAVLAARALYQDPTVVAVVGHVTSGATIAAARVYGSGTRPLPMISPTASSSELSGLSPYVFRVCPSDLSHGPALARFARGKLGARRAGILYMNDDYGRGVRAAFAAEFTRLGGTVVEEDPYLATTGSIEPYLTRMRGAVDVLLLAADVQGAALALREVRRQGIRWPVVGSDGMVGIESDAPLAEGLHLSSAYLSDRPGEQNAAFVVDFFRSTQGERPNDVAGLTFDIVQLLAEGIAAVGSDRRAVRDYLASVGSRRPAYEGVSGRIAFNSNGDVPGKPLTIAVVRNGRLVAEASE